MNGDAIKAVIAITGGYLAALLAWTQPILSAWSIGEIVAGLMTLTAGVGAAWLVLTRARIAVHKEWDAAMKDSVQGQLKAMECNQEKMRESLHSLRNQSQLLASENDALRDDVAKLSAELRETHNELRQARVELAEANKMLRETELALREAVDNRVASDVKAAELMVKIEQLRQSTDRHTEAIKHVTDSHHDLPAYQPPKDGPR
jgi:septal ring factor EnvC (AmiA/AmiB activator)